MERSIIVLMFTVLNMTKQRGFVLQETSKSCPNRIHIIFFLVIFTFLFIRIFLVISPLKLFVLLDYFVVQLRLCFILGVLIYIELLAMLNVAIIFATIKLQPVCTKRILGDIV